MSSLTIGQKLKYFFVSASLYAPLALFIPWIVFFVFVGVSYLFPDGSFNPGGNPFAKTGQAVTEARIASEQYHKDITAYHTLFSQAYLQNSTHQQKIDALHQSIPTLRAIISDQLHIISILEPFTSHASNILLTTLSQNYLKSAAAEQNAWVGEEYLSSLGSDAQKKRLVFLLKNHALTIRQSGAFDAEYMNQIDQLSNTVAEHAHQNPWLVFLYFAISIPALVSLFRQFRRDLATKNRPTTPSTDP